MQAFILNKQSGISINLYNYAWMLALQLRIQTYTLPGACECREVVQRSVKPMHLTVVEYHKLTIP